MFSKIRLTITELYCIKVLCCFLLPHGSHLFFTIYTVDCEWSEWRSTSCYPSCGVGERRRIRQISRQALHGGQDCEGDNREIEICNNDKCPGSILPR